MEASAPLGRIPVQVVVVLLDSLHLLIATLAALGQSVTAATIPDAAVRALVMGPQPQLISYQPATRELSNWRRVVPLMRAPAIMVGGGEPALASTKLAALISPAVPTARPATAGTCP